MAPIPSARHSEGSVEVSAFGEGDAAWLVRQFGRFRPLLEPEAGRSSNLRLTLPVELGVNLAAANYNVSCFRGADRARRLLQWSNRQHKERLHQLQRLADAHSRRLQFG